MHGQSSPRQSVRRRTTTGHEVAEDPTSFEDAPPFLSSRTGGSSWESYEGSGNFPSRDDRRKRFDATTPTLIDEEEEDLEFGNLQPIPSSHDDSLSNMRRTPGASQMHQSAVSLQEEREGVQLGFELAARTGGSSAGAVACRPATTSASSSLWEVSSQHASHHEQVGVHSREVEPVNRPSLARTAVASQTSSSAASGVASAAAGTNRSILSPWKSPETSRHGAFSPNLFRLTEDIGILLKEDEDDDDFAMEIPAVIRGEDQDLEGEGDWTGSYVFDTHHKLTRRPVARPSTATKEKARRRSAQQQQQQAPYFLPHAQQPKPRRNIHDPAFYFGEGRIADDRASPQLLTFSSGAFVPPKQDLSEGAAPFMYRPVASAPAPSFQHHSFDQLPNDAPSNSFPTGFSFQPQVFQSLQPPPGASPHRFLSTPSPTLSVGTSSTQQYPSSMGSSQQHQGSKMQATAPTFVPRTSTPQLPSSPSHWSINTTTTTTPSYDRDWPAQAGTQPAPAAANTISAASSHASPGFSYAPSYGYGGMPSHSFDARAAMTPSPLWPDAMLYAPPTSNPTVTSNAPASASTPTPILIDPSFAPVGVDTSTYLATSAPPPPPAMPQAPTSTTPQSSSVDSKTKKNRPKRREKKKSKPEKNTAQSPSTAVSVSDKTPKKKTGKTFEGPRSRAGSTEGVPDDTAASASEDQGDTKRAELDESPATRLAFKNFYKAFRTEEKHSFQRAEELALRSLEDGSLPDSIHYKVYLELADLAKRSNRYVEARRLYQKVCQLQPYASQGWLEYSKLEEECGFMNRVTNILHAGLEYCTYSESLLTRAVKHQERMGNLASAREILARLKHVGIEKVWRTVLEGALLEARAGNSDMARRVLKYLMFHVPWYGPLYLEAYKLERDQGHPDDALQVVQRGLDALPRYGPLWFGAFRLYEEIDLADRQYSLPKTMKMIERAKLNVSKELVWKVHLEAAQMLERTAQIHLDQSEKTKALAMAPVRRRLVLTILTCPNNLRWKVWLAAGRMELAIHNFKMARALFQRAHLVVQQKSRSSTLLDCARLEEYVGKTDLARAILCRARVEYGNDWKVWLESVLLEIRNSEYVRALEIASRALEIHTGTGRLWATLVQLQHIIGNDASQKVALRRALLSVPKSGEVWCEGGRIHLNPFSATFDLDRARRCLYFAAKFTPQFGDSFVESLRVEILSQWLLPIAKYIWKRTKNSYLLPNGSGNLTKFIFDVSLAITIARNRGNDEKRNLPQTQYRDIITTVRRKLRYENLRSSIDLTDIRLSCANADPNYGSLWFHCRKLPTDTPRRVIENAAELVAKDLFDHAHIYLAAMVRRMAVITTMDTPCPKYEGIETSDPAVIAWETIIDTKLRDATSLADMLNPVDPTTGLVFLESTSRGSTFVTGLVELSRPRLVKDMPLYERRRAVFGTDALLP